MKILILANNDVGLYQFRRELISELLKNHEVIIALPNGDLVSPLTEMGCAFVDTPVNRRGINPIEDLKLFFIYRRLLRQICPDLVITYTIKPNVYGGFACRLAKIPYAANITGLGTTFQKEGLLKKLVTQMYKTGLKRAKVVFFENAENRQIFVDSKIVSAEKSHLLNGAGVNLDHFQPTEYPAGDVTRFLFIGRVMREKGIDELFAAMKKLIADDLPVHLDVLGGYEEDYAAAMEQYAAEGWLTYHGYQSDVRPYIANAHCFVLPSWHEGMANTNLECAASGRPIITSRIHGCMEAVGDGVSGFLCEKKNVDDLFFAIKKFSALPYDERKAMGLAGRKRMKEIFDKSKVVEETIKGLEL